MRVHVVGRHIVARSLARLREQKTHTLFAGYLHLQQCASQLGRLHDLQPDFRQFFEEFFRVGNHPLGTPFIKPFTEQKASTKNLWLNENVAGSYAPSSLRPDQPFRKVVSIEGKKYSLNEGHAQRAFEHLLYSNHVRVADLAAVLYRDFGLLGDFPSIDDLVAIFAYEFGYATEPGAPPDESFRTLYSRESAESREQYQFETIEWAPKEISGQVVSKERMSTRRTSVPVRRLDADDMLSTKTMPAASKPFLEEILIEGLLSFGDKMEFRFGRLNLLVGPNGSGKSNLIDCLRILRYAPGDIQETFSKAGFDEWLYSGLDRQSGTAFLEVTAKVPEVSGPIRHQLRLGPPRKSRAPLEEVVSGDGTESEHLDEYFVGSYRSGATLSVAAPAKRRRKRELAAHEYDPFQSILSQIRDIGQYPEITRLASFYANFRIYSEWTFGRNSTLREATPAGRSETKLSESMDDLALALNGLAQTAAHERIRKLLRELKETYIDYETRILFGRVGLEIVETPFDQLPLPANRLSDGTLRFLAMAAILLQPDPPSLICLEEPELGMHPDMIRLVAEMIAEASNETQLIVTTHSEHLLSALQDDFDALFAFDTGVTGSVIRRFSQEEFKYWREEHTLGELWTSGELGGNRW